MMRLSLRVLFAVCLLIAPALAQLQMGVHVGPVTVGASLGGARIASPCVVVPQASVTTCAPRGYYKWVTQRVFCPGYWETVQVPAQYGWRCDPCGRRVWVIVRPATCSRVWRDGYWKCERRRVWVGC